jgi:hypothetical protein
MQYIQLTTLALILTTIAACSSMRGVTEGLRMLNPLGDKITFIEPPKTGELHTVNSVYLYSEDPASPMLLTIKEVLETASAGEVPYFTAVKIVTDAQVQGEVAQASSALITLGIQESQVFENRTIEQRVICPGDKLIRTCKSDVARYYDASCITRTASVAASLSGLETTDNLPLFSRNSRKISESKVCNDEQGAQLTSQQALLKEASVSVITELLDGLIPDKNERPSDLITEVDSITGKDAEQLTLAAKFATEGNLVKARDIYHDLLDRFPGSGEIMFNEGVLEQALGNFDSAAQKYSRIPNNPDLPMDDIENYSMEVNQWISKGYLTVRK